MKVSFVSTQAISQAMRYQMARMQAELVKSNKEVVTLRVADRGLALGARTGISVSFHREIERIKGLTDSNQLAASRLSSTQVVMQQLTDNANKLLSSFTTALSGSSDGKIARDEAKSFLASMNGLLNSHLNGEHLFAGINTDVTPLNDFNDPTSPNRVEFEYAFTQNFGFASDDPQAATISVTAMEDFISDIVHLQFFPDPDPANPDPDSGWKLWSSATDQQIVSRITLTETAKTSVSANIAPFRKLAMAASMVAGMVGNAMDPKTENVILEKALSLIGESVADLANQQGYTGIAQQRIERANESMSMQKDLISKSLNELEGIDENEAAVKVNGLLAQIELSYSLTARMQQMSLLKYL